jgi:glyoxylase-like metal-dependent hydrolase (beta-lactamase superfamily II)
MKIYPFINFDQFSNCYLITNDATMQAVIIDPCKITSPILEKIESGPYYLDAVLVTHNHPGHTRGILVLQKIYAPKIYAADYEVALHQTTVIKDDGMLQAAGLDVRYASVPGHTFDSMVFQIGQVIFTGDVITAGFIGSTYSSYAKRLLVAALGSKILSQDDSCIMLPGHGPPTTIKAEKQNNLDLSWSASPQAAANSDSR